MEQFYSSVSPKGQVTVPGRIRKLLNLRPKDRVAFKVVDGQVLLVRAESVLAKHYQSIPALPRAMTDAALAEVAWEEHAEQAAGEGL